MKRIEIRQYWVARAPNPLNADLIEAGKLALSTSCGTVLPLRLMCIEGKQFAPEATIGVYS